MTHRYGMIAAAALLALAACGDAKEATATPANASAGETVEVAPSETAASTGAGDPSLPPGEYACIGSGTMTLAGMGSHLNADGSYTDLDKTTRGTYRVEGSNVIFTGGHLDGETGRDIKDKGFTIGKMVSCQRWG